MFRRSLIEKKGFLKPGVRDSAHPTMHGPSSPDGGAATPTSTKDSSQLETGPLSPSKDTPDVAIGNVSAPLPSIDAAAERKLVRKLDLLVMVMIFLMYFFNSIDRGNLANAKTDGMDTDLGFVGNQYSILVMVFYVPFCGLCLPANLVTRKFQPKWFLVAFMLSWGTMAMICAACKDFAQVSEYLSPVPRALNHSSGRKMQMAESRVWMDALTPHVYWQATVAWLKSLVSLADFERRSWWSDCYWGLPRPGSLLAPWLVNSISRKVLPLGTNA